MKVVLYGDRFKIFTVTLPSVELRLRTGTGIIISGVERDPCSVKILER